MDLINSVSECHQSILVEATLGRRRLFNLYRAHPRLWLTQRFLHLDKRVVEVLRLRRQHFTFVVGFEPFHCVASILAQFVQLVRGAAVRAVLVGQEPQESVCVVSVDLLRRRVGEGAHFQI